MINLWQYEYCGKIRIVDIDGNEFIGEAQEVTDDEERSELEKPEIGITISTEEGNLIEFYASEIKSIQRI